MTHPITPSPELVQQWAADWHCSGNTNGNGFTYFVATRAAQWGWDQREPEIQADVDAELEACCKWLQCEAGNAVTEFIPGDLRAARRPKPPSLKEQALAILASVAVCELHGDAAPDNRLSTKDIDTIRRALEALSDG